MRWQDRTPLVTQNPRKSAQTGDARTSGLLGLPYILLGVEEAAGSSPAGPTSTDAGFVKVLGLSSAFGWVTFSLPSPLASPLLVPIAAARETVDGDYEADSTVGDGGFT